MTRKMNTTMTKSSPLMLEEAANATTFEEESTQALSPLPLGEGTNATAFAGEGAKHEGVGV